jgi:hypothetical protein
MPVTLDPSIFFSGGRIVAKWVPSKSRFGLFLALFLARSKNRQEQTKSVFLA